MAACLLVAPVTRAQEREERVQRAVRLQNIDAEAVSIWLQAAEVNWRFDNRDKSIGVLTGSLSRVDAAEKFIRNVDVPRKAPPQVELTIWLIAASNDPTTDSGDLAAMTRPLRSLFPYTGYRLLDTLYYRSRLNGPVVEQGTVSLTPDTNLIHIIQISRVLLGDGRTVGLVPFKFSAQLRGESGQLRGEPSQLESHLDLKDGQRTFLGKVSLTGNSPAVLVVGLAKILE
jgi:hypothetical protein